MRLRIDWEAVKREYITSGDEVSYRSLADKYGCSFGYLAERGRKEDWPADRAKYRSAVSETALENTRERMVAEREEMMDEALKLIRATFYEYGRRLKAGTIPIYPKDLATLIEKMQTILGQPTQRTETTVFGITADLPDLDLLRDIERVARARLVGGTVEDTPRLDTKGPRPN